MWGRVSLLVVVVGGCRNREGGKPQQPLSHIYPDTSQFQPSPSSFPAVFSSSCFSYYSSYFSPIFLPSTFSFPTPVLQTSVFPNTFLPTSSYFFTSASSYSDLPVSSSSQFSSLTLFLPSLPPSASTIFPSCTIPTSGCRHCSQRSSGIRSLCVVSNDVAFFSHSKEYFHLYDKERASSYHVLLCYIFCTIVVFYVLGFEFDWQWAVVRYGVAVKRKVGWVVVEI